jgi:class 3 adenylate cyclase/tetratricopeptide (TPR) repeat protein
MTFDNILAQVLELLQREGRVSYRALKLRFDINDDYIEGIKDELIYAKKLAVDEDGRVLVWTGEQASASAPSPTPGTPARATALPTEQEHAPLAYTPQHLAEKILTSRSALEGERKQVTVLFADLKGSMELLADRDPEEARQLLDPVLERMMDAVHRYEGTVNQVMGDGIMALFGAPIAHEDHAVRACYAALAMQEAIRAYADQVRQAHQIEIQIRVGLNSGEVVVRAIGNDLHMDYSAIGQTTHLAARMEQLAMPGSILLTAETLRLAEEVVQVKPLGPTPIRGLRQPLEVFELVGAGPPRTRLQAFAARALTHFVGRQAEFDAMRQAHERAGAGHGQLVAVMGEPGVGKTRLFYEFLCAPWTQGWLLLESQAASYSKATPYHPIRELLKAYFQLEARDDARQMRARVTGKLRTLDPALVPILPAVLALLDVPVDDSTWQALDPPQRRQRTFDALKRLLLRESQVQPVLLVCENLHWLDTETQAFLDSLVDSLPTVRILLLVNYRPEYQHPWGRKTYYVQLRLDPLPPTSTDELLQALLGDDPSLVPLKRLLIARTEGNPFFLEESVRTLVETGLLGGEPGAYRLEQPLNTLHVPATVQAVLAARIDRLPPEERRLLQTAAVIGTEVPLPLLHAIAELPEDVLHRGLALLQAAELLYKIQLFPTHEYTFKHALTHEVAYGSLLHERRRALHARIVEALEALAGDRLDEQVDRLAQHAVRGQVWGKALAYCRQAGEKALARSAHREAVEYFQQTLNVLPHLPETHATREQAIDLRLALRSALQPLGDLGRMLVCLREAEALAEALDNPRRLARISLFLSRYFSLMGTYGQAITAAQRALALATANGDGVLHALANLNLGQAYEPQGDYHRAIDCFGQTVAALDGARHRERFGQVILPAVHSRALLALCHAELGTFAEGSAYGDEGLRIAEAVGHPASLMVAAWGVGLLAVCQGDLHRALPHLERALGICHDTDLPIWFPGMAAALGTAYTLGGRVADAVLLLAQAMERASAMERPGPLASCSLPLGQAQMLAGRLEEAQALAERALLLARTHQERGNQAYVLRLLGEIAARREPPDVAQAAAHYRQALTLADELGMRPLQAHCHRGLGTLYATTGQPEQARTELSTAIEMYRYMDMTFWLPQAETVMAQVEGR